MDRRDLAAVAACVTAQVVLGVSVPLTRGIVDYPVMTGQAMRYALAAVALGLLARAGFGGPPAWRGWPQPRDLLALTAVAATGLVGFNLCMVTAVRHADPAVVGTIVGAAPLGLALIGPLMRRQRPSGRILLAAAMIVAGTALVHGSGEADLIGTLAAQLSAASSGTTAPVELDTFQLIVKDITVRGLLSVDERTGAEWVERFGGWLRSGEITFPHTRIAGIDRAPEALQGLLSGRYVGTVVVEL